MPAISGLYIGVNWMSLCFWYG